MKHPAEFKTRWSFVQAAFQSSADRQGLKLSKMERKALQEALPEVNLDEITRKAVSRRVQELTSQSSSREERKRAHSDSWEYYNRVLRNLAGEIVSELKRNKDSLPEGLELTRDKLEEVLELKKKTCKKKYYAICD